MEFTPNFQHILRCRTDNNVYEDDVASISLLTKVNDEDNTFVISLRAKRKEDSLSIRLETRIAIERHPPGQGHKLPHLQFQNFSTGYTDLRTGTLHITILPDSQEELDKCCHGFIYSIGELLKDIQGLFKIESPLTDYFFYPGSLDVLKDDKQFMQNLIYKTFQKTKIQYEGRDIDLVDYKGKKGEKDINTENPFRLLALILAMRLPHYMIMEPITRLILEMPRVKKRLPDLTPERCIQKLQLIEYTELQYLNEEYFLKQFHK